MGHPHLLELIHSLLQLYPHCVLLFPPGSHGKGKRALWVQSPYLPLQLPVPHLSGSGLSPWVWFPRWGGAVGRNVRLARRRPAAAVGRLHAAGPVPSSPAACPEPLGHAPATIFKSNCGCSSPSQCPSRSGPSPTSCLAGLIPHVLPTPHHQAHPAQSPTFSGTDPVPPPACTRTELL